MPDEAGVQMGGGQAMPASIPPEMQQQLMQMMQGMSGSDVTNMMAQLAQMSPDQAAQAIGQLTGQEVDPDQLVEAAKSWIDESAGQLSGEGGDGGPTDAAAEGESGPAPPAQPTGSAPSAPDEEASPEEGTPQDADYEMEGMEAQAQGSPADMQGQGPGSGAGGAPTAQDLAAAQQILSSKAGGGAMPRGGMPAGVPMSGGGMDAAISASLGGDIPGGPKLRGPAGGGPRMSGPASPTVTAKATKGTNQDMIRQMYRDAAAQDRGVAQTGVKRGPRTR
jgi:hypothetical protein